MRGKDAAYCYKFDLCVGLCVCLLDTLVSSAKTGEPIEVSFGVGTRVAQGTMY